MKILAGNLKHIFLQNKEFKRLAEEYKEDAKNKISKAEEERQRAVIKAEELQKVISSSTSEYTQNALVDAQRKIIVLKVNEEALTRRYVAASESETILSKEIQKLKVYGISVNLRMIFQIWIVLHDQQLIDFKNQKPNIRKRLVLFNWKFLVIYQFK